MSPAKARLVVLTTAVMALIVKLVLAANTGGTQDMGAWIAFAAGVRERGPVGAYTVDFASRGATQYNHPPLVGYLLEGLSVLEGWGIPLSISLRATAAVSDVLCALLVFEILRRRRTVAAAVIAGTTLAASPILLLVSGYHGNTDPLMMTLLWLGAYLLIDRRMGVLGGVAIALAISVKLAPIVALPTLGVWLLRGRDPRLLLRAAAGFVFCTALVWGPAMLLEWRSLRTNVFGYAGVDDRPWGLVKLMDSLDLPMASAWLIGPGRYGVLLVCAVTPAVLAWLRPRAAMQCVALSLITFLVLSPAFGVQYLTWAAAASLLLAPRTALLYNVLGGLFLFAVYADWNHGVDWTGMADGRPFRPIEAIAAGVLWAILVVLVVRGTRCVLDTAPSPDPGIPASGPTPSASGLATRGAEQDGGRTPSFTGTVPEV
jgi:hypothetical protein